MTNAEITDVIEESVASTVDDQASEHLDAPVQEEVSEVNAEQPQGSSDADKEFNFRQMRDQMRVMESEKERIRLEKDEFKNAYMELSKPKAPTPEPEVDEHAGVEKDDWITLDHSKKVAKREAQEAVREALRVEREERSKKELPDRLKSAYPDFDDVVTKENVDYLRTHKPHMVATLGATTDPYAQAAAAYEYIKAFCPSNNTEDKEKAKINSQRPGTLGNAQATSPLSQAKMFANGKLTDEMKKKLQQEMVAAIKGG